MPSCPVPSPVCMRISSACRSPPCQLVGGTTAGAGGQHRHVPLLCKGQPSCHPVQVSFASVKTAWSKVSPPRACHVACHTRPQAVLRSRCPNRLLRPSPTPAPPASQADPLFPSSSPAHSLCQETRGASPVSMACLFHISEVTEQGSGKCRNH